MKQCPICQGTSFDDAQTCFGCLHRFEQEQETPDTDLVAEPPLRVEIPLVSVAASQKSAECDCASQVRLEQSHTHRAPGNQSEVALASVPQASPELVQSERAASYFAFPEEKPQPASVARKSGWATLRRRGATTSNVEQVYGYPFIHRVPLANDEMRYELVVSLQPIG